eukprot:CAMPEP_0198523338 /NCGR_PEP_ID=MMETSP1462-20131121/22083_1 /TAXON_ID=1333877 /ORGANISM="Brandtodinium nutriculum, Strain RCC3387" /LENGTH=58 /DNA_ID=CAMNT_0044253033 /DNA_START=82 /DNA_END=254 /DNA_ORIENTATION=-
MVNSASSSSPPKQSWMRRRPDARCRSVAADARETAPARALSKLTAGGGSETSAITKSR